MSRGIARLSIGFVAFLALVATSACSGKNSADAQDNRLLPVAIGLKRDTNGLAQYVSDVSDPNSKNYLKHLPPGQLRSQFGASPGDASAALQVLKQSGFVGQPDATGSIVTGTMSVANASSFFDVDFSEQSPNNTAVLAPNQTPTMPSALVPYADEIAGLKKSVPTGTASTPAKQHDVQCPPAPKLTQKLEEVYALRDLVEKGNDGSGIKIAMLEIDQISQPAIEIFEKCFGAPIPEVTNHLVADPNPLAFGSVAEESTLDIVAAGIIAPGLAGIDTYQFDPYVSMVFPVSEAVSASMNPGGPALLSTSIGLCESQVPSGDISMMEWLFAAGSATGLTSVASAGDSGSSGCSPGTKVQAAQYPSTSTYVTSVGGTQFSGSDEVVWSSPGAKQAGGGSTVSSLPRPEYQSKQAGPGNRLTPDVALVAAPGDFGPIPVCDDTGNCTMELIGGTSATAPGFSAALAAMLEALRKESSPTMRYGLLNPTLYSIGNSRSGGQVLHDVTEGTNDLFGVGCCTAGPGYDTASGWGSVRFQGLYTSYLEYLKR